MDRQTLPAVLMAAMLVVSFGAAGAVAAPVAQGASGSAALQEGGGNTTATPAPNATDGNATNATEPATFGAVVSSFMQTSAADAETEVEDGLFEARFDRSNASEQARLVRQRATQLGDRIAELREERSVLLDGGNATVRERAEAARLAAQANSLAGSIDDTEDAARRANVSLNRTKLDELRTNARNLTGPEVSELARGLIDGDEDRRRGPPEDRGPDRERGPETEADGNETDEDTDRPGRSGDARRDRGEGDTEAGPPGESTNGTERDDTDRNGPPEDRGSDRGNGPEDRDRSENQRDTSTPDDGDGSGDDAREDTGTVTDEEEEELSTGAGPATGTPEPTDGDGTDGEASDE